jgi:15-cis-phytoene synthase
MDQSAAYRHCEDVVRSRARNFAYGIRLLPKDKRQAMCAVYAFARRIDDIADGDGSGAPDGAGELCDARLERLNAARADLKDLDRATDDPVLVALADAARRHPIPLAAFEEVIEGCEADVRGTEYASADALIGYCRCVAGAVGRLSLGVYGVDAGDWESASMYADALGIALQLTNILRDVREDAAGGRVYLPADDLERYGCTLRLDADGCFADRPEDLIALVRAGADRALVWYDSGLRLLPLLDRRSAACTAAMAGIYRRLLTRIAADPLGALNARASLPTWEKAVVAGRALTGARA